MSATRRKTKRDMGIPGMIRPPPHPKQKPIEQLSLESLREQYKQNQSLLATTSASSSAFVERLAAEQTQIQARIKEIEGVETIRKGIKKVTFDGEEERMAIDKPGPYISPAMRTKQKALAVWGQKAGGAKTATMSLQEAIKLEQQAHMDEQERLARQAAKKEKLSMPTRRTGSGKTLSQEEFEAKMWAFMNYKPSDSDLEDDDDDDDDNDPASWFDDDQDDGVKGQDIIYPDADEFTDIIRIDDSKLHYSSLYEPNDEGD